MYDDLRSTTTQSTYLSTSTMYDDLRPTTTQSIYLSTSTMYDDLRSTTTQSDCVVVDLKSSDIVDVDR
jgi:hypothetical protein